jgi:hypothetical protein
MKAVKITTGLFRLDLESEEIVNFYLNEDGLMIKRSVHKDDFISYHDLLAKAENQLTLPIP